MTETDISKIHEQLDFIYSQKTVDGKEPLAHFIEQAKLGADFTIEMIEKNGLKKEEVVILDIACGGVYTRQVTSMMFSGEMTSHYRPYYLAELSRRGIPAENLIGLDIGTPDPNLAPLYQHKQTDLKTVLSSGQEFIDYLRDTLTPDQFSKLTFIASNNFFGNISPDVIHEVDDMYNNLLAACEVMPTAGERLFIVTLDGPHDASNVESVMEKKNNKMITSKRWSQSYNSKYFSKFDFDD